MPGRPDLTKPIHKTESTTSVTELDLEIDTLLNPRFKDFLAETAVESLSQPGHRAVLRPVQVAMHVSWVPTVDPSVVRLVDKSLRIEVRQGTRPEERVFFISCPTDSRTHDTLLVALEKAFADKSGSVSGVVRLPQRNQ